MSPTTRQDRPWEPGAAGEASTIGITDTDTRTQGMIRLVQDLIRALNARYPRENRLVLSLALVTIVVWTVCVAVTGFHHEFWRDEVRPLTFAREAVSFLGLWDLIGGDGHPALWPAILYFLHGIFQSNAVLGLASSGIGFLAACLLVWKAPLPLWVKGLAIFSSVLLYEYAVMARNYGISMLLMFVFAWLYRDRSRNALWLGLVLALLANSNIHSACLALVFAGIWFLHEIQDRWHGRVRGLPKKEWAALSLLALGLALSAYTVWPDADSDVISKVSGRAVEERPFDILAMLLFPAEKFVDIVRPPFPIWQSIILLALCVGLVVDLACALGAVIAVVGLAIFFEIVAPGYYRHQALIVPLFLSLYWIAAQRAVALGTGGRRLRVLGVGQLVALPLLLIPLVKDTGDFVLADLTKALSSSAAFGDFLRDHPEYAEAILVGEPAYQLESLPYYLDMTIYLPRERRFGTTVRFGDQAHVLRLTSLLDRAQRLALCESRTVLIVFGHPEIDDHAQYEKTFSYGSAVTWSAAARRRFFDATVKIASFRDSMRERYDVFEVIAPARTSAGSTCAQDGL